LHDKDFGGGKSERRIGGGVLALVSWCGLWRRYECLGWRALEEMWIQTGILSDKSGDCHRVLGNDAATCRVHGHHLQRRGGSSSSRKRPLCGNILPVFAHEYPAEGVTPAHSLAGLKERREAILCEGNFLNRVEGCHDSVNDREAAIREDG